MSKLNSFIINTELVKEDRKFKRTTKSYNQLLDDYSNFERELEALDILQYKWETSLAREKYKDDKLYVKINSSIRDISEKILKSSELCDYINDSPIKEESYELFKKNNDNSKGYILPEINETFLDYIIDYNARVTDIVVRQTNTLYSTDLSTLLGFDHEPTPGYQ